MKSCSLQTGAICAAFAVSHCAADPAINQFEIKDLEVELGQLEFQSQNAHSWDHPDRQFVIDGDGELEFDDTTITRRRHALEFEYGTTEWMRNRIGIELEQENLDDPPSPARANDFATFQLEEIALEGVIVFIPTERHFGAGLLIEYQYLLDPSEADSLVFGPILEARFGRWDFIINPTLVQFFAGTPQDNKLDFAYGAHALYTVNDQWTVGAETYGTIERIGRTGTRSEAYRLFGDHDFHRIGPISYYRKTFGDGDDDGQILTIGTGFFIGLNEDTSRYTLKWSIEYEF
ncbi:MAG: hypothetical protein AAF384_19805 [Pseudomonadota bacterium]